MSTGTTTTRVSAHFTAENVAVLRAAEKIVAEISYTYADNHEPQSIWRDNRVIERADVAQSAIMRLLTAATVYYELPEEEEA
jgi:hypothetical protein